MHKPEAVAKAFLIESGVDLRAAKLMYEGEVYSRTIFSAQQAMEKVVKACLASKGIFTTDHHISSVFSAVFGGDLENIGDIVDAIDALEQYGARARFPLYRRGDLPIWIPSREYGEVHAGSALRKAEFVFEQLKPEVEKVL